MVSTFSWLWKAIDPSLIFIFARYEIYGNTGNKTSSYNIAIVAQACKIISLYIFSLMNAGSAVLVLTYSKFYHNIMHLYLHVGRVLPQVFLISSSWLTNVESKMRWRICGTLAGTVSCCQHRYGWGMYRCSSSLQKRCQVIKVRIAYYIFWHYLTSNSIILACAIIFVCYHFRDTLKH